MPVLLSLSLLLLTACGADEDSAAAPGPGGIDSGGAVDPSCAGEPDVRWNGFGEGFFSSYCDACHSAAAPDRFGAPEALTFDTLAEVRAQADLIELAVLVNETMPSGGGVREDDRVLLEIFLRCGL